MTSFKLRRTENNSTPLLSEMNLTVSFACINILQSLYDNMFNYFGGGVALSNPEFALFVGKRSGILNSIQNLSVCFSPFLSGEGTEGGRGDTNNSHNKANEFRPEWGGCHVATGWVKPNLVAMTAILEGWCKIC